MFLILSNLPIIFDVCSNIPIYKQKQTKRNEKKKNIYIINKLMDGVCENGGFGVGCIKVIISITTTK